VKKLKFDFSSIKLFYLPILTVLVVVSLSLSLGKILVSQINEKRANISNLDKSNTALAEKLNLLSSLDEDLLAKQAKEALSAVPSQDSSLNALSTIRNLALTNSLFLSDLEFINVDKKGTGPQTAKLSFDTQGGLFQALELLDQLSRHIPVMAVPTIRLTVSGGSALARFEVASLWAPLPDTLGDVDAPIEVLNSREQDILGQLRKLEKTGVSDVEAAPPQGRQNPFAF